MKTTLIVQEAAAARGCPEAGHVFEEMAKSVASLKAMVPIVMPAVPLFVTVMVLAALVVLDA